MNLIKHKEQLYIYFKHRFELHDVIRETTRKQRENEIIRYNRDIKQISHIIEDYIMIYQKNVDKFQSR